MDKRSKSWFLGGAFVFLSLLLVCGLVFSVGTGLSRWSPGLLSRVPYDEIKKQVPILVSDYFYYFPRISLRYVFIPVLFELIFTIPLTIFFYREFVRVEAVSNQETTDIRPKRFRSLVLCSLGVTAIILLFLVGIYLSPRSHSSGDHWSPPGEARTMSFMFLVVMNPIIYQVIVGLRISLRFRRLRFRHFREFLITTLLLAPLVYALMLTAFFCMIDYRRLLVEKILIDFSPLLLYDIYPPELSLWITGLSGLVLMWLSIWSCRKYLLD